MEGMENDMKSRLWMKAILAIVVFVWVAGFQGPARGQWIRDGLTENDQLEKPFESDLLFSPLQRNLTTNRFRMPLYFDPMFSGGLDAALRPSVDLIDRGSYSLKLTLPVLWDQGHYGAQDDGGTLGAGLFATFRLNVLPARYGSWSLNTGLFLIRKEPNIVDQILPGDLESLGRIGTINISISY